MITRIFDACFMQVTGSETSGYFARYRWDSHPCWSVARSTAVRGCRQRLLEQAVPTHQVQPGDYVFNTVLQVLGAALGLAGTFLIGAKNPLGFWLWIGSNVALVWLHRRMRMPVLLALHLAYTALSIYGLVNWQSQA